MRSPSRKTVAPIDRKTELDSLERRELDASAMVLASEEVTLLGPDVTPAAALVGIPRKAASAEAIPGKVAPSASTVDLGFSLDISPSEPTGVSGAFRGAPSPSPPIDSFPVDLRRLCCGSDAKD